MRVARFCAVIAWSVLAVLLFLAPAVAEKRVALVIGNGAYKNASKLPNPTNDAKAIAGMLQSASFDAVELHENLGIRELRRAIGEFSDIARDADTAIVYYSGHGIEVYGNNYLIPVDAVLDRDSDVPFEAYSLDSLLQVLEPVRRMRLVMLDACRDNPFARSMKRTVGSRAIGRGLAAMEPTSVNTLIGFAAKAGSTASDGEGANSPYAIAVMNNLATPGLDLRIAFGRVRDEVMKSTKNKQEPFTYGSLGGAIVTIVDAPKASTASAPPQPQAPAPGSDLDRAERAWAVTQNNTSIAVLEDFISQFGSTPYGSMARARLAELKKSQVAVIAPPAPNSSSSGSAALLPSQQPAQESACTLYKVNILLENVTKDPAGTIFDVVQSGDVVCITRQQKVDSADWGYIAYKLEKPNRRTPIDGWSLLRNMTALSPAEAAVFRSGVSPPTAAASPPSAIAPSAVSAPPSTTIRPEDVLRFDQPIPFGPSPVNGHSIKEIIENFVPLFPPIEGLEEALWKKNCASCHQWDQARLCEQGGTYLKAPKNVLRHSHPFGGTFKVAVMRWAKSGCR